MATTQHGSAGRRAIVALLAVITVFVAAASVTGTSPSGSSEKDEDELVGIAGRPRLVVNPAGTVEAAFPRESYAPGDGRAPPLRERPPADDPAVPVRAGRVVAPAETT